MGNICGNNQTPESKEIDKQIKINNKKYHREKRVLLLGPGESGKSTIFKQMKILDITQSFTQNEMEIWTYIVYNNLISEMIILVRACQEMEVSLDSQQNVTCASKLLTLSTQTTNSTWDASIGHIIKALWNDSGIQRTFEFRDRLFQLNDSAEYFFSEIDRIIQDGYIPSLDDILRARVRSTGIEETEFKFEDLAFKMIDVGGQRSERRKWMHCFQNSITAVIYVASLSEYDQALREETSQNRMDESIYLFEEVANNPTFKEIDIILFLNKTDLFRQKIEKGIPLTEAFHHYDRGQDYDQALEFVKKQYLERNKSPHTIYVHFTCAVSTDSMKFVFKAVKNTLLKKSLEAIFLSGPDI